MRPPPSTPHTPQDDSSRNFNVNALHNDRLYTHPFLVIFLYMLEQYKILFLAQSSHRKAKHPLAFETKTTLVHYFAKPFNKRITSFIKDKASQSVVQSQATLSFHRRFARVQLTIKIKFLPLYNHVNSVNTRMYNFISTCDASVIIRICSGEVPLVYCAHQIYKQENNMHKRWTMEIKCILSKSLAL